MRIPFLSRRKQSAPTDPLGFLAMRRRIVARAKAVVGAGWRPLLAINGPYRGGEVSRLTKNWQPGDYSGEDAIDAAHDLATRRLRDQQRNSPVIIALERAFVDNVVADGIRTTSAVMVGNEFQEDFNFEADEAYEQYGTDEVDSKGVLSDPDIQRQAMRELLNTGEVLLLRCGDDDPNRQVPLCYQVLESEQLDSGKDELSSDNSNEIRRGIELDRAGRKVAYWLFDVHPGDSHAGFSPDSIRVPAERVIHVTLPGRPSTIRGIGLYASIMQPERDLDNYLGSELTSATIGSLLSVVQKTANPGTGMGFSGDGAEGPASDDNGNPIARLGRGIVTQIPRDDDIAVIDSNRPNSQAEPFIRLIFMLIGMGGNVSRYRLTRDYSGITYVAARAAHLDDRAGFRPMQGYFGRQICRPIRRDWTVQMAAMGRFDNLSATQFRAQRPRWLRFHMQPPGWEQIDPEKETDAAIARIAAGISTLEDECSGRGKNWRRLILQREREIKFAAAHGVELNFDRPSTPAAAQSSRRGDGEREEEASRN